MHLAQELLMNLQCSHGSRRSGKERRALKLRLAIGTWQRQPSAITEAWSSSTTREIAKELNLSHSTVIWHLKQIGKVKKWQVGASWADRKSKKSSFESSSSLVPDKNNEPFLDQTVTCNEKWVLYNNWQWSAQWLDWEEPPKHFPKWNLYQKRSLSLFGGLLPVWSTTAFWIPVKPLHVRRLLSKSKRCTGNCKAYTWYWSTERAQFICMTTPNEWSQLLLKLNKLGYEVSLQLPHSPDFSPTDYHFFNHLNKILQGKCFHNQQETENAFEEFPESRSTNFYITGINKLISCGQKCIDCNVYYFD